MHTRKLLFILCVISFSYMPANAEEGVANEAPNYFSAAVEAQKGKRYGDAEAFYKKTVLVNPMDKRWPVLIANNRGVMFMEIGDFDTAEQLFREVLTIDPNFKPAQINLGFIIERRSSELESMKYWMKVLNIDLEKLKPKELIVVTQEQDSKKGPLGDKEKLW